MPKGSIISKTIATAFAVLTVSSIAGIVTMIIVYQQEISNLNMTAPPTITTTTMAPPPSMRLPKNLIPHSYKIFLKPNFYTRIPVLYNDTRANQTMLLTGNSTVRFHCVERTSTIYLNSRDLLVVDPLVFNEDTNEIIQSFPPKYMNDDDDFLEIQLRSYLEAGGNYSLFLTFMGKISENPEGLYISKYTEGTPEEEDDVNAQRYLAVTCLQPTMARSLFPCFDEPEMKAMFNVTIIHRKDTVALSNAQEKESSVLDDNWKYTSFYPTERMSTYLFAFMVSEFKDSTRSPHDSVIINVYARPEAVAAGHTQYAANITGKILTFYEKYLGMTYSQKNLDQVALPDLFPGAMENWGLVTYQESALLYEEGVSSLLNKEYIATIIAHELAHQWFGNLVTMKWWNDIWLNEGFATYMSFIAVDSVEPTFRLTEVSFLASLHGAFEEDALASTRPLSPSQNQVQTASEIEELFDTITYSKGAVLLRMLADVVGESVFLTGVKSYLSAFKYQNTNQNDLWDNIQKAIHSPQYEIADLMEKWTKQNGYPVLTINTKNGEIYQKHFQFNDTTESSLWWRIPIRHMSNISKPDYFLLETVTAKKDFLISKEGEWILANINSTGYYRVNYDTENWNRLLTQLEENPDLIPLMNRGQLIDDAFNLARAKLLDVTLALKSTLFLRNETEYICWESAIRNTAYFVDMFDRSEVFGPMQVFFRQQVLGLYNRYKNYTDKSTVPDSYSEQRSQIMAITVACSSGLPECLKMAAEAFAKWMNSNSTNMIHPNLRSQIYCHALAVGGKKQWEFAWDKMQSSPDTSEKNQLREALSCTKKVWLLNRYLDYTLDPEKIRLMDVFSVIYYISRNVAGQALAWNFVRANWDYVSLGHGSYIIQAVTKRFSTQFELDELKRFSQDYKLNSAEHVQQAIEQTQVNIEWVKMNREVILDWFESQTAEEPRRS